MKQHTRIGDKIVAEILDPRGDTSRVEIRSSREATHTFLNSTLPSPLLTVNVEFFYFFMFKIFLTTLE